MTNSFFYFAFADIRCTKDKAKEFGIWIMLRSTASILQKSNANKFIWQGYWNTFYVFLVSDKQWAKFIHCVTPVKPVELHEGTLFSSHRIWETLIEVIGSSTLSAMRDLVPRTECGPICCILYIHLLGTGSTYLKHDIGHYNISRS